ncbi:ATP-binding protein [Sneathiella chinensis]|uniref:histidine kinase n=1 Tax=Sneathiella chinensis TaxID=349750 RepID=A0ABQ5U769_9PROT|nr:ATP-binding protein [Sneathiella chinensis]GLQ07995.1 two-component sensor histidine kinase [Sneathiella chinensis]
MTSRPSLQNRLAIGISIGVTFLWLAALAASALVVRHELDEAFDSALQETAQRILPLAVTDIIRQDRTAPFRTVEALDRHEEFLTYLVRDRSGTLLIQSHDANPDIFPARPATGFRNTKTHRIYGESAVSGTLFLEIAEPLAHRKEATFEAIMAMLLPLFAFVPATLLAVIWFVRRTLKPVVRFREEIERRNSADLSPVQGTGLPREIAPLADAVNILMERLRFSLEAERNFTANSAHELRTPVAAALAQTQRLMAETRDADILARAQQIEGALKGLSRLAEKLLQLAKAEGGGVLAETPTDLMAILPHVTEDYSRVSGTDRIRLENPANLPLISRLDPDAFGILIRNLVENALKHGAADTPVILRITPEQDIRIINGGPAVDPDTLTTLKRRFARGAARSDGFGIGLAIADTIARRAGGRLKIHSPATGQEGGFEVVLTLPPP